MEGLHKMGLVISINSNGTMIDENTVAWLKNCPPVRINISLYGASDATYARLCGNPKGFTQVTNAIRLLKDAGITVKLNCSLTPYNAEDLPQMVEFAKEKGLYLQIATYMFPPVRKDASMVGQNDRFTPEEAAYYMAYADFLTMGAEKFLEKAAPTYPEDSCATPDGIRCRAGKCSFWITWQGQMTPCGMFPTEGSLNVFQKDFSAAWEQVKAYSASIRLPEKCAGCSVKEDCHACGAMVITESGCFDTAPEYRCDMMHAYPAQYGRVKEKILWERQKSTF
jgi:radical SAM protein with 4Fe4S-binding SPASM domain